MKRMSLELFLSSAGVGPVLTSTAEPTAPVCAAMRPKAVISSETSAGSGAAGSTASVRLKSACMEKGYPLLA